MQLASCFLARHGSPLVAALWVTTLAWACASITVLAQAQTAGPASAAQAALRAEVEAALARAKLPRDALAVMLVDAIK
jgi:D-alanyl-D-alanine carboxypeptidase/D-alanyl-D-alanine-endopeptidase (penicillin-binding protein 4)